MTRNGDPAPPPPTPTECGVPVRGGELPVHRWEFDGDAAGGPPVVALHGITANGRAFDAVARALAARGAGPARLYAPDLRGRGGAADLPGPWGIGTHVEDVCALLDALGEPRAVLVGHSMGAYVAALAAARHPDRFPYVVLVDGGLGFPAPEGTDVDEVLDALIGPAVRRLSMTFPDPGAYRDFFRAHPALAEVWGPDVASYVDRDLVGPPGALRSSCVREAVRTDGAQVLADREVLAAIHDPRVRGVLLWADRGPLDDQQALYDEARLAAAALPPDRLTTHRVPDTNHYTVLLAPAAAAAIAEAVVSGTVATALTTRSPLHHPR